MELQNDLYSKVVKLNSYTIEYKNINLLSLSQVFIFELSLKRLSSKTPLHLLKRLSLDNYIKSFLTIRLKSRKLDRSCEFLIVNDVYNQGMISNLRRVKDKLKSGHLEIICDRRIKTNDNYILFRFFNFRRFFFDFVTGMKLCVRNFNVIKSVSSEFKINKYLLFLNLIESIYILNCSKGLLTELPNLKKAILNSDIHKVSKALSLTAQKNGVKTYVIQHGTTVLEYGYLPVSADYVFTWGELSNKWFIERGTDSKKLIITGTPKMDLFKTKEVNKEKAKDIENILVVVNPIGESSLNEFFNIIYNSKIHLNYNLSIKLHPGSVDNKKTLFEYYSENQVKIYKNENIHDLIKHNDLVIMTTSTVGSEAIAFYKPLIKIEIYDINVVLDFDFFNCSHNISNAQDLIELITNQEKVYSKIDNYENYLDKYFYKLDGMSSHRIIKHLIEN